MGRPSKYTEELAKQICEVTATSSKSLKTICEELDLKPRMVLDWLSSNKEFSHMYARAKEEQADLLAEEIISIADDSSNDTIKIEGRNGKLMDAENKEWVNRSRLRVDARKWIASKLKPRKYGDKIELSGDKENPLTVQITGMEIK